MFVKTKEDLEAVEELSKILESIYSNIRAGKSMRKDKKQWDAFWRKDLQRVDNQKLTAANSQ